MRRRAIDLAFAAVSLIAAVLAADFAWQWHDACQLNATIETASQSGVPLDESAGPEGQLARALVLARTGASDAAIRAYKALTQGERDDIRQAALYDLGNLYLREALKDGATEAMLYLPLIELAKQNYRSLLRLNGDDWDARRNLELALRLAPEYDEEIVDNAEALVPKERAITTMAGHKLVLP
jgi:mxaK protein